MVQKRMLEGRFKMNNENYGFMIGLGIACFFGFVFARLFKEDLGLDQNTLNTLGFIGGLGLGAAVFGFYMLITKRNKK